MRDARREAFERVGGRFDVRVLEPSPPVVEDPPYFADDPVAGGELVPVERSGARRWAELCDEQRDVDLLLWCQDRWLVQRPLAPLPPKFAETRAVLHGVAEKILSPRRAAANGKIGLRFTYHGFGTPFFGRGEQMRVEDGVIVDGDERTSVAGVDAVAARALGSWYGFCASLLEQVREDAVPAETPSRVQIWPEHFDMSVDVGVEGARANFGGSPGDADHPEPYLYVGPWEKREGPFWNESFGASLGYGDILDGADPLEFLRRGKELLQ